MGTDTIGSTPLDVNRTLDELVGQGPNVSLPRLLWDLRAAHPVGTTWTLSPDAAMTWPADLLGATLEGGGLVPERSSKPDAARTPSTTPGLAGTWRRDRTLADLVGPDLRLLIVGLNPSLVAADCGVGFAGATNRFWPAAMDAGLVSVDRDPLHAFVHHGIGMSDLVKRA
ncbi:MAG: hypothetical protein GX868_08220, partial [Actinobacteria bacterium]|nr:hypothetical protein [Actinomycetota bacterium]